MKNSPKNPLAPGGLSLAIRDQPLSRNLAIADQQISTSPIPPILKVAEEWMGSLSVKDLILLRQATLRVHRSAVGPMGHGDPTVAELDAMIASVGPVASENMLRRAVDEKLGEYDRGRHGHSKSNDADFRRNS